MAPKILLVMDRGGKVVKVTQSLDEAFDFVVNNREYTAYEVGRANFKRLWGGRPCRP